MNSIEQLNNIDFSRFGLVGSVVGALLFIVVKVLMMIDRYNKRLFDIIEQDQDQDGEQKKSWSQRNRENK